MTIVADANPELLGTDLLLGRVQDELLAALGAWPAPHHVVLVEHDLVRTVDLRDAFPSATVRRGALGAAPDWTGWPDLLWLGLALSTRPDAARAVIGACRALPDGALVAAADLAAVEDPALPILLRDGFGLDAGRDTRALLRRCFSPLYWLEARHPNGLWTAYGFVGVKLADRDW